MDQMMEQVALSPDKKAVVLKKIKRLWHLDLQTESVPEKEYLYDPQVCGRWTMASILKLRVPAQGVDGLFPGNAFDDPPQGESPEKCEISCVNPISHFGDSDVWSYTLTNKLPRGSLYDEGYKKIGCKCCPPAPKDTISSIAVDEEKAVKESLKSLGYL